MKLTPYKELSVWQRSVELVKEIYTATKQFPREELYALSNQMRRAAVSIPSNIAEGYVRQGLGEYIQFLKIAEASAAELETQIIIAKPLYNNESLSRAERLLTEVQKMLFAISLKLNAKRK